MTSNQLLLARAHRCEGTQGRTLNLQEPLTPAQVGAAVFLEDHGWRTNRSELVGADDYGRNSRALLHAWDADTSRFWKALSDSLEAWTSGALMSEAAAIGYWLSAVRSRGMTPAQSARLTRFLAEPILGAQQVETRPSVRRYPTGGISEKQAILLPGLLRVLADSYDFCSSFLVARRLAHTGGTRDKLSTLPGFSPFQSSELVGWMGEAPPVRYFTAAADFCPRDEALYFLRGETGTVVEPGLMAASILAKHLALPANVILIDVLYGPGAFLASPDDAASFVRLAAGVSDAVGLKVLFEVRATSRVKWRSIGNVTEIVEAVELASPQAAVREPSDPSLTEFFQAEHFACSLMEAAGHPPGHAGELVRRAWLNGDLQASMYHLWRDHQVEERFLATAAARGIRILLDDLTAESLPATVGGVIYCEDVEALADVVNNQLNAYPAGSRLPVAPRRGGLLLGAPLGSRISVGTPKLTVYSDAPVPGALLQRLDQLVSIEGQR